MLILDPEEREILSELREKRILDDIDPHRLQDPLKVLLVTCADGHHMADIFRHQESICSRNGSGAVVHTIALNGGAMILSKNYLPNLKYPDKEVMIRHIIAGCEIKGIDTLAYHVHAPCGAARGSGLKAHESIKLALEGKQGMREILPIHFKMGCFAHVDWGNGKKRTYFVRKKEFFDWLSLSSR